jgi:hypothetical protein
MTSLTKKVGGRGAAPPFNAAFTPLALREVEGSEAKRPAGSLAKRRPSNSPGHRPAGAAGAKKNCEICAGFLLSPALSVFSPAFPHSLSADPSDFTGPRRPRLLRVLRAGHLSPLDEVVQYRCRLRVSVWAGHLVFLWIPEFSRGALWAAKVKGGTRTAQGESPRPRSGLCRIGEGTGGVIGGGMGWGASARRASLMWPGSAAGA